MNERLIEILIVIMSEIRGDKSNTTKLEILSKDLLKKGYTESEISSAFSWLLNRLRSESEEIVQNQTPLTKSFRVLHEIEKTIISPEAFGYIIQLKELGLVNEADIEFILERALMLGTSKVDAADIKSIVASMLFNVEVMGNGAYLFFDDHPVIQ